MVVEARPSPMSLVPVAEPPMAIERLGFMDQVRKFLQPKTSPAKVPSLTDSNVGSIQFVTSDVAISRPSGAATYRAWATTPWVYSAISIRKDQIAAADWDIVPADPTKRHSVREQKRLRELFDMPSLKLDSFQSFASVVINDLLTLDAGIIEKVRYPDGEIAELWPVRGEWIGVDERWDGSDPEKARYYFIPDGTVRASFKNEDMVYMIANPRANSAVGLPPPAILASVIDSELQAMEYNRRMVMGAPPDGALNIGEDASAEKVIEAQSYWSNKIFGQGAMAIIGGFKNPEFIKFRDTNQEMQFREWQDLLVRCIAIVYGLAPMDLGITFDVNRSTAEQSAQNTDDRGARPLLGLVQRYFTREIVWDASFGGKANNLKFVFKALNLSETKAKADINKVAMPGVPWKAINEARDTDGRAPLGDSEGDDNIFNHLLVMTPKGMLDLTTEKYVGEEHLAGITTDSQVEVAEAQGDIDQEKADAAAEHDKDIAAASPAPVIAPPPKAPGGKP